MLSNIKSYYIIKIVFTYLNEKQKLLPIKYNKSLQKDIDISLINYKYFKGIYIIYEANGIVKEYDGHDDKLIYEGEYLNGQRNGKGKEYDYDGNFLFKDDYLNVKGKGLGKKKLMESYINI